MLIRRRVIVGGLAVVIVAAAGTSAWAMSGGSGTAYRLATVGRGSVVASIDTTGVISPIKSANVDFQVSGTVRRVIVKQGQRVRAGEVLARLKRADLRATLTAAESTLSAARETLTSDEASQSTSTVANSTSTSSAATSTGSTASGNQHNSTTGNSKKIQADQLTLVNAQRRADADLATAKAALAAEKTACASELSDASSSSSATSGASSTASDDCTAAVQTLYAAQSAVSKDQRAVQAAQTALTKDLGVSTTSAAPTAAHTRTSGTTSSTSTDSGATTQRHQSTSATDTASATTATTTVTAAQLASDQATIDTDRAAVATARANLAQAVVRSPMSGRVVTVTVARGDQVSGSSSSTSPAFQVVGSPQSQVTIGLTAAQIRTVKTGMQARVTADGAATSVTGIVTSVGIAAAESSTGSSTYPVVIAVSKTATSLVSGADAAVSIVLAHVRNALIVPTSAVHRSGEKSYVETLANGRLTRTTVTVGAMGATTTQILAGLTTGQRVILANLNAAVPSSSSNLTTGGGNGFRSLRISGGPGPGGFSPPGGGSVSVSGK